MALTNGTSTSRPSSVRTDSSSPAGGVQHLGDRTEVLAVDRTNGQPLELVVVELVGIIDGRQLRGVDHEQVPAQRVGPVAIGYAGQADQQPPTVRAGRLDDHVLSTVTTSRLEPQAVSRRKALVGIVGANVDHEFAGDAVGLGHTTDDELHA